ncbi:Pyridine nucleotide-disulfide oxidoreductase domain-containing 2 [Balamuthia mandrillaris]
MLDAKPLLLCAATLLLLCASFTTAETAPACYKKTSTRGVGTIPNSCPSGFEGQGLLCYPLCQDGFYGVGPVCWQACPADKYTDTGAFCQPKTQWGDSSACPWYDKCGLTFKKGCVRCPSGMEAQGCVCHFPGTSLFAKKTYGRGVGKEMICSAGKEKDAGLCYPPCPAKTYGVGPVCWQHCPPTQPFSCAVACTKDQSTCSGNIAEFSSTILTLTLQLVACVASEGAGCPAIAASIAKLVEELNLPLCEMPELLMADAMEGVDPAVVAEVNQYLLEVLRLPIPHHGVNF